ncbi:MAG: acyl-CoA ligase (AMP-forming), exosortase A system-associated [Candidatus Binatia bacterium]|nr:MAG: acyl-CoA ligase (AMP-forming), exosortase A system-associated [Candidatus Binatia bacterium]
MRENALVRCVARHAKERGSKVAVCEWDPRSPREATYSELYRDALRYAGFLSRQAPPGEIVPLLTGKSVASIAAMLGAMIAGRPFCFLNPKYRWPQVAAVLRATDASLCVLDATGSLSLRGGVERLGAKPGTTWLWLGGEGAAAVSARTATELRSAYRVVERSSLPEAPDPGPPPSPASEVGACLFTSGSSGEPKGVLVSTEDLVARTEAEVRWFGLGDSDVLLSVLPFSFDVGLNQLLSALYVGAELVLLKSWLPADIVTAAGARRVTGISAVPAIWQDFLRAGLRFDTEGQHAPLRYVTVSGGSLPAPTLAKLRSVLGRAGIFKTYGQTEAFRTASLRPEELARKPESVGRAFPGARFYVVDEDGKPCPPGEVGEIVHTGLGIMLGYLGNRELTPEEERKLRPNPFYGPEDSSPLAVFTGDLGFVDPEGYLYLKGRRDSMTKIQGNRVYPLEVAAQLLAVPGVEDAVVLGVAGPGADPLLVAFVVPARGSRLSPASIRKELNLRLPSYMIPQRTVFVERIPRTATGKPDEKLLRERASGVEAAAEGR